MKQLLSIVQRTVNAVLRISQLQVSVPFCDFSLPQLNHSQQVFHPQILQIINFKPSFETKINQSLLISENNRLSPDPLQKKFYFNVDPNITTEGTQFMYVGCIKDGLPNGLGIAISSNSSVDVFDGFPKRNNSNEIRGEVIMKYGFWKAGLQDGFGSWITFSKVNVNFGGGSQSLSEKGDFGEFKGGQLCGEGVHYTRQYLDGFERYEEIKKNRTVCLGAFANHLQCGPGALKLGERPVIAGHFWKNMLCSGEITENGGCGKGRIEKVENTYIINPMWPILYEGNFQDYKLEGEGKIICHNGIELTGQFQKNEIMSGKFTCTNGNYYEGQFDKNQPCGAGSLVTIDPEAKEKQIKLTGTFITKYVTSSKKLLLVEGWFPGDQGSGRGKITHIELEDLKIQQIYEGDFVKFQLQGAGSVRVPQQMMLTGTFQDGFPYSSGIVQFKKQKQSNCEYFEKQNPAAFGLNGRKIKCYDGKVVAGRGEGNGRLTIINPVTFKIEEQKTGAFEKYELKQVGPYEEVDDIDEKENKNIKIKPEIITNSNNSRDSKYNIKELTQKEIKQYELQQEGPYEEVVEQAEMEKQIQFDQEIKRQNIKLEEWHQNNYILRKQLLNTKIAELYWMKKYLNSKKALILGLIIALLICLM